MKKIPIIVAVSLLMQVVAQAHGANPEDGFMSGFTHPVLGLDHLLAMVAVGILSAQMGGRAVWSVPAAFVGMMLVGGLMGMNGIPFFEVELGIAISVLVLGVAMAADKKLPTYLAMIAVAFFAVFHGHAHGTEMPEAYAPALYATGFVAGTSAIHLVGVLIGVVANKFSTGPHFLRSMGAAIAIIGGYLIFA